MREDQSVTKPGLAEVPQDLIPLDSKTVRRLIIGEEWFYSIDDLLAYFREDAGFYKHWFGWFMQRRDELNFKEMIRVVVLGGKEIRVTSSVGVFRLVQGVKGQRAERLKSWLAQIAVERATEEVNPSLAVERAVKTWYRRGYSDAWINERLRSIRVRRGFTDELQLHGVEGQRFAILTNIVHQGTFGITVRDHYALKDLVQGRTELREEMTTTELILMSLGEHTSTVLAQASQAKSIPAATQACEKGGEIAGNARKQIEEALGRAVVTSERASDMSQPSLADQGDSVD